MSTFDLPPAYDPKLVEDKWYRAWEEAGLFHAQATGDPARRPFCVTIPPPNVNGELHMGHALQHCIHDVLARWHRMQGAAVLVVPGTDHASIATNRAVEKKLKAEGISRLDLGREKFVQLCWEWTHQVAGTIIRQLKSLGCSYDWDWGKPWTKSLGENWIGRFTMDEGYVQAVLEAFVRFYEKGWIYRGVRIVNWCPQCRSTVSDLEVDHEDTNGHLWHIRYPLADGTGGIIVATTRPETMLGDTAVAVHAHDERYQEIIGKNVILPLMNRHIPIIGDDTGYVDPSFGSGAVKVTPAHDLNDFEAGQRHSLPNVVVIGLDGTMTAEAGKYAGMDRYEARKRIVKDLEAAGLLVKVEDYSHAIGRHDRCDTVIEPLLSEQWFLRMNELAKMTMEAIEGDKPASQFVPGRYRDTSMEWLENLRDWNISRQIWWGHRIPVWYCEDCGTINVAKAKPVFCKECNSPHLTQDEDTLDTWFSSALWPFAVLGWPDEKVFKKNQELGFFPTSTMITAREIIYLWVLRMIMTSEEFVGQVPFYDILIHPVVMDLQGRRMSKSLGIGLDPVELISKYGADATRFGILYQCSTTQDIRFGEERVETSRNFCNKLWNASRFVFANISDANLTANDLGNLPGLVQEKGGFTEQWIIGRLQKVTQEMAQALTRYRFDEAARGMQEFLWGEYCDWYLEIAKVQLNALKDSNEAAAAKKKHLIQATLAFVLECSLRLMHPFLPFITEEIWQKLPHNGDTIMTAPYPAADLPESAEADMQMGRLLALATAIRRMRADRKVPAKEWTNAQVVTNDAVLRDLLTNHAAIIAPLTHSRQVEMVAEATMPGPADHVGANDQDVARAHAQMEESLSAAGLGDIYLSREVDAAGKEAEVARMRKAIEAAQKEIERVQVNLSNEEFVSRAPEAVVTKMKQRLENAQAEVARMEEAIREMGE
jgi:valyl-tRNA synthetase